MAPPPLNIPDDEEEFLDLVEGFYKQRGVSWDRQPKIAGRYISLLRLYKIVMEEGGYDKVSAERMKWRPLVGHFGIGPQHEGQNTFQLKTLYYKNLAAFEIYNFWNEQPPPPEILESLSAKGGGLRNRTLENFQPPNSRDSGGIGGGVDSADEEQRTPRADTMDIDEPESGGRYPRRHLRQDPRPTQMYQPDLGSSRARYARTTTSPQASPVPVQAYNSASADPRNPAFNLDQYQPRQPMALTLRPVVTPGANPDVFRQRKALAKAQSMPRQPPEPQQFLRHVIPNSMNAPNIYIRCLYGLRSGLEDEQDFALHHLVKVSFERGDKYKFEGFPLLAESLLEKVLEVTIMIYGVKFEISYDGDNSTDNSYTLNASYGTPRLLERLRSLKVQIEEDGPQTADFCKRMEKLNEAALVIRNMVILEENAAFIAKFPLFRDFLVIALNLPSQPRLAEFQHYALEMAEQVTRYWNMHLDDALYISLLAKLESNDRGTILPALQSIVRIAIDLPSTHQLTEVSLSTVERLMGFLLLENDDALTLACLDFLYQYTASPDNIKELLALAPDILPRFTPRLITLLLHNATPTEEKVLVRPPQKPPSSSAGIANIPQDLFVRLAQYPEPDRSSRWLKCCFEESPPDDITQIAIWQAYQGRFQQNNPIPAADFIKNVSSTFTTAQAQVINGPQPRFIIKGIRPRRVLVGLTGEPYYKCMWELPRKDLYSPAANSPNLCSSWHSTRQNLWTHLLVEHFGIPRNEDAKFSNEKSGSYVCKWSGCLRSNPFHKPHDAAIHVRAHIPESAEAAAKAEAAAGGKEAEFAKHTFFLTQVDEKNFPCGIPYMSVMLLRNLARFAMRNPNALSPKKQQPNGAVQGPGSVNLTQRFFGHVKSELWYVISVNKTLIFFLADLMKMVEAGEVGKKTA